MVVIKVEMWPHGDESRKYSLASATIANIGGDVTTGDYEYKLFNKAGGFWKAGFIKGFPRKRLMAFDLLYRALKEAFGKRNGG